MAPTSDLSRISLRNPDALLAAVPYLLGFHPADSAVLLWLSRGRILLTQRLDLPESGADTGAWLAAAWNHPASGCADELIGVLVSASASGAAEMGDLISARAADADVRVRDLLRLDGTRWWSLLCTDDECCPPAGRILDATISGAVAAEFAFEGRAPMSSRADLVAEMDADPVLVAQAVGALDAMPPRPRTPAAVEAWRDESIEVCTDLLGTEAGTARPSSEVAQVLTSLRDVRVRDTVMWEACRWSGERRRQAISVLIGLVRQAPATLVAPAAALTAALCWLDGDGARACVALDRCLDDDPEYSLGALLRASILGGLPPEVWRGSMSDLTRHECRHGTASGPVVPSNYVPL